MRNAFRLDADGNYRSELLETVSGLDHGFGTKSAALPDGALATVKQIHSATVIDAGGMGGPQGEGDALIGHVPDLALGIKTADCVPILLVDPIHRVAAAVHAGWRGTVLEIVGHTLSRMTDTYRTNPANVRAAIGPAIGRCCYKVGPEVSQQFAKWGQGIGNLDLADVNRTQLIASGIPDDRISCANLCTKCQLEHFYSFRREAGEAGRMISWIGLK